MKTINHLRYHKKHICHKRLINTPFGTYYGKRFSFNSFVNAPKGTEYYHRSLRESVSFKTPMYYVLNFCSKKNAIAKIFPKIEKIVSPHGLLSFDNITKEQDIISAENKAKKKFTLNIICLLSLPVKYVISSISSN